MSFPAYRQLDAMDCGPTCIRIISKHYGQKYSLQYLKEICYVDKEGVSLLAMSEAAEKLGFRTLSVRLDFTHFKKEVLLPCVVHWERNHFIVVYKITRNKVYISDPARGLLTYTHEEFIKGWASGKKNDQLTGIALLFEPTHLITQEDDKPDNKDTGRVFYYLTRHKRLLIQLLLGLGIGLILQLALPFFAQAVVDTGIATKDIRFIYLILLGQIMLFIGSTITDFVRGWILLHISTRINLSLLSNYWIKLMALPISYFDSKITGDILQRVGDHKRIESFLTGSAISTIFSLLNFVIFTFIVIIYDPIVFAIFLAGSILYFSWVMIFLKVRRKLDMKRFALSANTQNATIQMIHGMQEIRLNNCETKKRWEWEALQAKLFRLDMSTLRMNQLQQGGAMFINQLKNIIVTFYAAKAVVEGTLTLGGMLAIQYIIGQLNSPIQQFIQFIQSLQDARISLERINEVHNMDDEEPAERSLARELPSDKSIVLKDLSYRYNAAGNNNVLDNINLYIPEGKTTAIVGASGSGKTTLLKLLLMFYPPTEGTIKVADNRMENISPSFWRRQCGVVMQDGFIFSDTIAGNIAVGDEYPHRKKLLYACKMANIQEYIDSLPLGFNTKIGADGNGLSQGQRQRLLIARAIYKDPEYIFLDEATNALDANNEKTIMENLDRFFEGRTVVVVAHRLSTVKNADQIIVLDKGKIVETGTHEELTSIRGNYYHLVKNQLELGN